MTTLGAVVRRLRKAHDLTQAELAERAGVGRAWLSLIEADRITQPSGVRLTRIAAALDTPVAVLIEEAGQLRTAAGELNAPPGELIAARQLAADLLRTLYRVAPGDGDVLRATTAALRAALGERDIAISDDDALAAQLALAEAINGHDRAWFALLASLRPQADQAGAQSPPAPPPPPAQSRPSRAER